MIKDQKYINNHNLKIEQASVPSHRNEPPVSIFCYFNMIYQQILVSLTLLLQVSYFEWFHHEGGFLCWLGVTDFLCKLCTSQCSTEDNWLKLPTGVVKIEWNEKCLKDFSHRGVFVNLVLNSFLTDKVKNILSFSAIYSIIYKVPD